ncbi:hypothetical protein H6P81_001814 [Aristolochia fimbriata]|uniref:Uncharacterized protein n=1 Tax=Aristolochia fimbriata TaxID=158543 RepID=A0AAV7FBT1_ARIFI|nr:hypothetical protein H6P81_001814 [Aristolochia fimbriata]
MGHFQRNNPLTSSYDHNLRKTENAEGRGRSRLSRPNEKEEKRNRGRAKNILRVCVPPQQVWNAFSADFSGISFQQFPLSKPWGEPVIRPASRRPAQDDSSPFGESNALLSLDSAKRILVGTVVVRLAESYRTLPSCTEF